MRNPQRNIIRKEDLIYNPTQTIGDGFESGLSIAAGDRELAKQMFQAVADIQNSEDELRRTIVKQQNEVQLLNAKNKLSLINQEAFASLQLDPEQFKVATNEQAADIISELPLLLRSQAKADFVQEQTGYYYRARNNQREYLDKQKFEQLQINNRNIAKFSINAIKNIVCGNSLADQIQGQADLGMSIGAFENNLYERGGLNQELFDEEKKYKERQNFFGTMFETFSRFKLSTLPEQQAREFIEQVRNGSAVINYTRLGAAFSVPSLILDDKKRNAIATHLEGQLKEELKARQEQEDIEFLKAVENHEVVPDYKDKHYREIVDKRYVDDVRPLFNPNDPKGTIEKYVNFIDAHQTISEGMVSDLRSGMYSNDPAVFAICSDIINDVRVHHKHLLDFLPKKDFAKAEMMSAMMKLNTETPIIEAFETVHQAYDKTDPAVIEQRTQEFENGKEGVQPIDVQIAKIFPKIEKPGLLFGTNTEELKKTPAITLAIWRDEVKRWAKVYYLQGSDMKTSLSVAESAVNTNWGLSNINGASVWTKYPVENFYNEYNSKGQTLREVLLDWLKVQTFGNVPKDTPLDSFFVAADAQTQLEAGNRTSKPSYSLKYIDEYGRQIDVVDKNGQFVRVGREVLVEQSQKQLEQPK